MKQYQAPEILLTTLSVADIITESESCFVNGIGIDNLNKLKWWGD